MTAYFFSNVTLSADHVDDGGFELADESDPLGFFFDPIIAASKKPAVKQSLGQIEVEGCGHLADRLFEFRQIERRREYGFRDLWRIPQIRKTVCIRIGNERIACLDLDYFRIVDDRDGLACRFFLGGISCSPLLSSVCGR